MKALLTIAVCLLWLTADAQQEKKSVVIGSITTRPNALLIVNPPHSDQGVLLPQLSTHQRMSITPSSSEENGLIVFDTDRQAYYYWSNGAWLQLRPDVKRTQYYGIDPVNFRELKPDFNTRNNNMVIFETDNTFVTTSRDGLGEEIMAPINLMHGAVIKEVTLFYMDNDDKNIKVLLQRKALSGTTEAIVAWESAGMSPVVNSIVFQNFNGKQIIDLENFTYRLIVAFDIDAGEEIDLPAEANQRVYGVRIKYDY